MQYQHMDKQTFTPFSEFYQQLTMKISYQPAEEILKEAEEIRRKLSSNG